MDAEVSGRAFLGIVKYIKSTRGTAALAAVVAAANAETRTAFERPIRVMTWYPYSAFVGFLHGIDHVLGRAGQHSFCRELGDVAGVRDLGTVLRVYRTLSSPE